MASSLATLAIIRTPKLDSAEYLGFARALLGGAPWPSPPPHGPGYPLFLAAVLHFSGDSLHLVTATQALIGGMSSALIARLAWRLTGDVRTSALSGLLTAVYGPLVCVDSMVLAEGPFICLLLAATLIPFEVQSGPIRALATGTVIGIAALVRPTALVLVPLLAWMLVRRAAAERTRLRIAGMMIAAAAVVVSPVVIKNWRDTGSPMIQAYFGLNAYLGNSPTGDGLPSARLGGRWQQLDTEARRAGALTPAAADRYYLTKLAGEWQERPGAALAVLAEKAVWLFQGEEVRDSHSFWFFRAHSKVLGFLPTFAWIMPIAVLGAVAAMRQHRSDLVGVTLGYAAGMSLTVVLLVMSFRYRLPITPMLCLLAAVGLVDLYESAGRGAWRHVAAALCAMLLGVVFANVRHHPPSHNYAEEWAFEGMALSSERRPNEAREAFSRALAANQHSNLARRGLGLLAYNQQDWLVARREFDRAVGIDAADAFSHRYLGLLNERAGDLPEAIAHLRAAGAYRPDDLVVSADLARVLTRAGAYAEATDLLQNMVRLAPRDPRLRATLAGTLVLSNRSIEAVREIRIVRTLDGDDPQVPCMAAVVELLAGDTSTADADVVRCRQAVGPSPSVRLLIGLAAYSNGREAEARRELTSLGAEEPGFSSVVRYLTEARNPTQQARAVRDVLVKALTELLGEIGR